MKKLLFSLIIVALLTLTFAQARLVINGRLYQSERNYTVDILALNNSINLLNLSMNDSFALIQLLNQSIIQTNSTLNIRIDSVNSSLQSEIANRIANDSQLNATMFQINNSLYIYTSNVNSSLTSIINIVNSSLTQNLNQTNIRIDVLNLTKLDITDQRYNDTALILLVNQTLNTSIMNINLTLFNQISSLNISLTQEIADRIANDTYLQNQINALNFSNQNNTALILLVNSTLDTKINNLNITTLKNTGNQTLQGNLNVTNIGFFQQLGNTVNRIIGYFSDLLAININSTNITATNYYGIQASQINNPYWFNETDQIYIYNTSTKIFFNESKNNATISNISKVITYTLNLTINTASQSYNISSGNIEYMITQITVIPNSNSTVYKFTLMEYPSYNIIDRDLSAHSGIWNIKKSYALNSQVIANITLSNPNDIYQVQIKYVKNG